MTLEELSRFIGQTVTIFTTSGGASGIGFTGVLLRVNNNFVTLVNRLGSPPTNPLEEIDCNDMRDNNNIDDMPIFVVGSICDIPLDKIAAFSHVAL